MRRGGLAFTAPWSVYIVVLAGSALGALAIWSYAGAKGRSQPADRLVLASLRLAILGLIVFCLFRPVLVISTVVPDRNFLGILIDDSKSMPRISDCQAQKKKQETHRTRSAHIYGEGTCRPCLLTARCCSPAIVYSYVTHVKLVSSASGIYPAFSSVKRSAAVARAASGLRGGTQRTTVSFC